jgi:hypothetical protein
MGQLQQQKVAEVQNRMAVEQMRAKMAQEQRQQQFLSKYSEALPEDMRGLLQTLSPDEAMKVASQEITRPKQVFQTKRDPQSGKMLIVFGDGTRQLTDVELPRNTKDRDIGNAIQVIDEDTGEVIETITKEMSPYQAGQLAVAQGNLAVRQAELERGPPSGGDGKIKTVVYEVEGAEKPLYAQGQDIGGGFVRVTSGRHAGLIMKRASANKDWQREEIGRQLREELGS